MNEGELELPQGDRVPVRIENESAGGFGIYCNADVNVWDDEVLLFQRGSDLYEVRVVHATEVDVPRRSGAPEPEWLPLRIGLERLRLIAANVGTNRKKHWLKRLLGYTDRPTNRPMILVGLLLAVIFVAAPYISAVSGRAGDRPFFVLLRATSAALMEEVISWFDDADSRESGGEGSSAASLRWRETTERLQRQADAVHERLEDAAAPVQLKANALIDDAQHWLDATAASAAESAARLQENASRETNRWMETGSDVLDSVLEKVESDNAFEEWEAAFGPAGTIRGPLAPAPGKSAPATPAAPAAAPPPATPKNSP